MPVGRSVMQVPRRSGLALVPKVVKVQLVDDVTEDGELLVADAGTGEYLCDLAARSF